MTVRTFDDGRTSLEVNFQIKVACVYAYPNRVPGSLCLDQDRSIPGIPLLQ